MKYVIAKKPFGFYNTEFLSKFGYFTHSLETVRMFSRYDDAFDFMVKLPYYRNNSGYHIRKKPRYIYTSINGVLYYASARRFINRNVMRKIEEGETVKIKHITCLR